MKKGCLWALNIKRAQKRSAESVGQKGPAAAARLSLSRRPHTSVRTAATAREGSASAMPSFGNTGYPPHQMSYEGRGWMPERTFLTPRSQSEQSHVPSSAQRAAAQRRTLDPGPDILNGQRNRAEVYGGGARWDFTPARAWDGEAPVSHRRREPSRAVAPHRPPTKEVTGKVTGEVSQTANPRDALGSHRRSLPARSHRGAQGEQQPAPRVPRRCQGGALGSAGGCDVARPGGARGAVAVRRERDRRPAGRLQVHLAPQVPQRARHHRRRHGRRAADAWRGVGVGAARHRAFDGAYGATTLESSPDEPHHRQAARRQGGEPRAERRRRRVQRDGRQGHRRRRRRRRWAAAAARRHEREFEGAAGLNSAERAQARNRERRASAEDRVRQGPKGAGMQPPTVFHPTAASSTAARRAAARTTRRRQPAPAASARRARAQARYEDTRGGKPAGVRNAHQAENAAASPGRCARPDEVGEVRSAIGNMSRRCASRMTARRPTSRQINSALPELKAFLIAGGEMRSRWSRTASEMGGGEYKALRRGRAGGRLRRGGAAVPQVGGGQGAAQGPRGRRHARRQSARPQRALPRPHRAQRAAQPVRPVRGDGGAADGRQLGHDRRGALLARARAGL